MDKKSYALVTGAYWGFTLTDGALRMMVLLHFHHLGYSPVNLAFLFLLYEFCGILTNLFGGWVAARFGLRITLFAGLGLQIFALGMLSLLQPTWLAWASVAYVMTSQAISGIAKDLTKMSSKSAVKLLVQGNRSDASADDATIGGVLADDTKSQSRLFKWVAVLTGSKNALKGLGFLLGGVLLDSLGFAPALWVMAGGLAAVLVGTVALLKVDMGKTKSKVKISDFFSKSREINVLSFARFFLFGSRDVWFVVGLPIFLASQLGWSHAGIGGFLSAWVIGYGLVQAVAPRFVNRGGGAAGGARVAKIWGSVLLVVSAGLAIAMQMQFYPTISILIGLTIFGVVFAVNSSVHSYLILAYTDSDKVALNVAFYYMANACGRLLGTLLSGVMFLVAGLAGCLWASTVLVLLAALITLMLPTEEQTIVIPHGTGTV